MPLILNLNTIGFLIVALFIVGCIREGYRLSHLEKLLQRGGIVGRAVFLVLGLSAAAWLMGIDHAGMPFLIDELIRAPIFWVHEAGHVVLSPFGETPSFLGGTILQLLVPLSLFAWAVCHSEFHCASIFLFYIGFSLVDSGRYIADASAMKIPAVGGTHDWNFLFGKWGLLPYDTAIGHVFSGFGSLIILLSIIFVLQPKLFDRLIVVALNICSKASSHSLSDAD